MDINVLLLSNQIRGVDGTGGLGDVPVGLAKSLLARGDIDIRLAMPGYAEITGEEDLADRFTQEPIQRLTVPFGMETRDVRVYEVQLPHSTPPVTVYLFRCTQFDERDASTGKINKNTPDKAVLFARSAMEFLRRQDAYRIDLIHCNDWHSGLVPAYLHTIYRDDVYLGRLATLYTSHNAGGDAYQGGFADSNLLSLAGLQDSEVFLPGTTQSFNHYDKFNFTKGGFGFSDIINTVSRQYRKELLTPAFAGGLEGLLKEREHDFCGIVNGIDISEWDPATDKHLQSCVFSAQDNAEAIRRKKCAVRALLRNWQVKKDGHPRKGAMPFEQLTDSSRLVGVVTRIDYQKVPILCQAIDRICATENVQVAFLGSADPNDETGKQFENELRHKSNQSNGKLLFFDGFDIPLSHLIYAASEMFLVPSVFEPCGLTQIVAMRYGSVPIVRSVGGLVDTVIDNDDANRHGSAAGFRYDGTITNDSWMSEVDADANDFVACFQRANEVYGTDRWGELILNGMRADCSWTIPSMQYVKLYHEAVRRAVHRTQLSG